MPSMKNGRVDQSSPEFKAALKKTRAESAKRKPTVSGSVKRALTGGVKKSVKKASSGGAADRARKTIRTKVMSRRAAIKKATGY